MPIDHSDRVSRAVAERKARFRAALAIARLTAHEWAEAEETDPAYLSRVLAGKVVSRPMVGRIDAFIAKHLKQLRRTA